MSQSLLRVLSLTTLLSAGACGIAPESLDASLLHLNPGFPWYGKNRERLDSMVDTLGRGSSSYDKAAPPVAIFDWDNTVIKNDIGDATLFYALRTGKLRQPRDRNWRFASPYLTADAVGSLSTACEGLAAAGEPLPTHTAAGQACADEILSVYSKAKTVAGKAAFAGWNYRRMEPSYALAAQLLAGLSADEARALGAAAMSAGQWAPIGATQQVGGDSKITAWLRINEPMHDLIATLQRAGFDVWVVSASQQHIVEAAAEHVGIARDHVIGIRNVERGGLLTADLQGCGDVPDGQNDGMGPAGAGQGNSLITYIDGKRCWINKVIYGDRTATALTKSADLRRRQVFAAGDSDTDITFLQDATTLKLVLNRNKSELMCNAYADARGHWLINPMFVQPLKQRATPYLCSTTACKDETGRGMPCRDEDGNPISDQSDRVFAP
jgi:phosphoserine phosphatase